ncbi:hypothetical protein BKA62DRAFT_475649 [Auriculariales sp. MPI-PUGE-AT-0066]|nr:hypothetical protein BKA62DRAFT_475649 [Auriculariales sp. MPI-PUGE-AT-0066]
MSRRLQFNTTDFDAELARITASGNATSAQLQAVRRRLEELRATIASRNEATNMRSPRSDSSERDTVGSITDSSSASQLATAATASGFRPSHSAILLAGDHTSAQPPSSTPASEQSSLAPASSTLSALDRSVARSESLNRSIEHARRELAEYTSAVDRIFISEASRALTSPSSPTTAQRRERLMRRLLSAEDVSSLRSHDASILPTVAPASPRYGRHSAIDAAARRTVRSEHNLSSEQTAYLQLRASSSTPSNARAPSVVDSSSGVSVRTRAESTTIASSSSRRAAPTVVDFNQRRAALHASMAQAMSSPAHVSAHSLLDPDSAATTRALLARSRRTQQVPTPPHREEGLDVVSTLWEDTMAPSYGSYNSTASSGPTSSSEGLETSSVEGAAPARFSVRRRRRAGSSDTVIVPDTAATTDSDVEMSRVVGAGTSTVLPRIPLAYGPLGEGGSATTYMDDTRSRRQQTQTMARLLSTTTTGSSVGISGANVGRYQDMRRQYLQQQQWRGLGAVEAGVQASTNQPAFVPREFRMMPERPFEDYQYEYEWSPPPRSTTLAVRSADSSRRAAAAADSAWRMRMEFLTSTANLPLYDTTTVPTRPVSPTLPPPVSISFTQTTEPMLILELPMTIDKTLSLVKADAQQEEEEEEQAQLPAGTLFW